MGEFIAVAKVTDIPPDSRKRVEVDGKKISIFNIDDQYYAIFDTCPHKKTAPRPYSAGDSHSLGTVFYGQRRFKK